MEFYKFIGSQLCKEPFTVAIVANVITLQSNGKSYSEPFFDASSGFTDLDLKSLQAISDAVWNGNDTDVLDMEVSVMKCWYLLTHEKYFKDDIQLDRYDRIGQANLREEFLGILKVPVADVLKKILRHRFDKQEDAKNPNLYLTCDFDSFNIWDDWSTKDFIRELVFCSAKLDFRRLRHAISSFLFSRRSKKSNGYLNTGMYDFNPIFTNIGFFIALPENKMYDGKNGFGNALVQKYLADLKKQHVVYGLHANFGTMDDPEGISRQVKAFEALLHETPKDNRHHYLRFIFPEYLKTLEAGNIERDFSMYFPESTLFRAGTCSRYSVWNQELDRPFKTALIPTTIMDGTFTDYLHCGLEEAYDLSVRKLELAWKYSDSIVLLWHNRSTSKYSDIQKNYHSVLIKRLIAYLAEKSNQSA